MGILGKVAAQTRVQILEILTQDKGKEKVVRCPKK